MDNEVESLHRRIYELENYINDYHEMLEGRLQWQAERVVSEVCALINCIGVLVASLVIAKIANDYFPDRGLIGEISLGVVLFASWVCVGVLVEKLKKSEISRLGKPWNFVRKIDRFE